uniref:FAD-dependent monooxygenase atnA n=1 Tax=Arthrinium sp. TaxID=1756131 RepID=ATNA_ARTSZ|nr:RecName: Full=FAD-dependent monooxygenase atnA; AltName: Full=Arthripenoid biosynthesis cluster protein A [Arthrinium sp.]AYO60874.1 FAD-dependent monooxygenase AtnA [Arthrinium sp.]
MATPFKVLIVGGGVAGLSLAIMLEAYGFDYELLEKHPDVAPKLGAGVGLTPNGARILDQIGVWDSMCEYASPVDAGIALSPTGNTVIFNPHMGEWLEKLFGYKIHFLSRHDCLRILFDKIKQKSNIHLRKEVTRISVGQPGEKAQVETKDGSTYIADLVIGADGVRSSVRNELWRIADTEKPGYIPNRDKSGIVSIYTAVIGIAHDPGLPRGGSARAYNHLRSYFTQEGVEGSGVFYWWLCTKNEEPIKGIVPKLSSDTKQTLLDKYADDQIGHGLTLGGLYKKSVYSAIIPLQEFVLEKCFYKNILLIGDTFRKLHPVAGQGANSAIEESALVADILWQLRENNALHDAAGMKQALTEFQEERFVRTTALREDANLVQRMESFDNLFMKFLSLHVIPRLPFVVAFLPQLGSAFTPARCMKYLPPPKAGMCPFSPDMQAKPNPRSPLATISWIVFLTLAACFPWSVHRLLPASSSSLPGFSEVFQLYTSVMAVSISGLWVIESYKASLLISPMFSSLPWILASNYWGWDKTLPVYLCFHVISSQHTVHYYTPQFMTDLGAAKALLPCLAMAYSIPGILTALASTDQTLSDWWPVAHCTFPVLVYVSSTFLRGMKAVPQGVEVVFSSVDLPYQRRFLTAIAVVSSAVHVTLIWNHGAALLNEGIISLLSVPLARTLASLTALIVAWGIYMTWEMRRIFATEVSLVKAWAVILVSTVLLGPAASLAGATYWSKVMLEKATSMQPLVQPTNGKS